MTPTDRNLDDTVPLRIRTRRTLTADGKTAVKSSVACRRRCCDVALDTCLACEHASSLVSMPNSPAYLYCRDPEAAASDVVHRPVRSVGGYRPPSQSIADRVPVSAIMARDVVCVRPDVSLAVVTALLLERRIGGAPVVDALGKPIGVVSKTDLVRATGTDELTVGEVMTPLAFALSTGATISQAAALMAYEHVHQVPITGTDGSVVGIVSALDVARFIAKQDGYVLPE